jgi:hypothetical protein
MRNNPIQDHIRAAADAEHIVVAARKLAACWPGGTGDRTEPAARGWLRHWRPARAAAAIPACSCPDGRCVICN